MATSHDNFHIVTLIDRATGESARVRDIADNTVGMKVGAVISGSISTDNFLPGSTLFVLRGTTGGTLTLGDALKARIGGSIQQVEITVADEGGNAGTLAFVIDTESGLINGGASVSVTTDYGKLSIHSDGTNFFAG